MSRWQRRWRFLTAASVIGASCWWVWCCIWYGVARRSFSDPPELLGGRLMRIAVDYTAAVNQTAGIGRFVRSLIKGVIDIDQRNQYLLVHARPNEDAVLDFQPPGMSRVGRYPFPSGCSRYSGIEQTCHCQSTCLPAPLTFSIL